MGRIKKITLPLFFIIFFAAAFIFLSSHFMGSHFEPETDLANSSLLNNQSTNVKPVEQEKPKIVSDKGADSTGLTEEEKQRLANEPVGNLEDGTRSVIVKLRDINANDLREANPGIDDEAVLQTLGIKAFGAGSLGAESGSTPDINSYYKNAISKKADKLIAEIEHLGGDAKLDKKLKVSPIVFFHVNAKGLEDLKRSALVESVENNHMIFATATEVPLSPDPIAVMGGNSANGFSFAGQNFNGSNYAVAVLDTGVDRLHEKLQGKVIGEACFSYYQRSTYNSLCPGSTKTTTGVDEKHGTGSAQPCTLNDLCAHGSHVASDAALSYQPIYNSAHTGEGTTYSDKNYYSNTINGWISGGARDASVFAVQVFSMKANQSDVTSVNSAWLAAVDWIVENADNRSEIPVPISAINLSLGSGGNSVQNCYTTSSSYRAIFKIAKANDIAVFIANGNAWDSQKNNVATPSCTIGAVSVAASNNSGTAISSYSQNSKAT
ncbi:MAG: S8 family serine peptidase, partial [Bifidobacteriaceae bacterium]|nr:S8 family serine peptidase [Bifidobacteriaceae bacterium]